MITIEIEIVYQEPGTKALKMLTSTVPKGTTVAEVIKQIAIKIDWSCYSVGIFGKTVAINTVLQPGDRIEFYHNLLVDPKILRKQRIEQSRTW